MYLMFKLSLASDLNVVSQDRKVLERNNLHYLLAWPAMVVKMSKKCGNIFTLLLY